MYGLFTCSENTARPQSTNVAQGPLRRLAHNPRVVGLILALTTFEASILGQGVTANCASLNPTLEYKWVPVP